MRQQTRAPLTLFYSYAHEDELLREQLEKHLRLLSRLGLISEWHDREILPGAEWAQEINAHLETASMILLFISPDFLASDYCYAIEMQRALERHKRGEARLIPIIVRPVDWHSAPFGHLQCLPRDGKSITEWDNQDAAFREIAQELRRILEQRVSLAHPAPHVSPIDRQNRLRLLKRVRTIWIEGVLECSLHQASLIALDLQEQPDALANPWHLAVQETDRPPRPLPGGTSIVQVYDESGGELLLLGEPGAGKTTLLLELACTLLERAEADEHERLPVVFNLSSWAEKRLPLSEWLIEELRTKYQVPHTLRNAWIADDQILLLLDGLDEVAEDARPGCVQAINVYYQSRLELGATPLVVCCRSQEYMALPTRVNLHQAVSIQPLTDEQIEHYLQSARGQLEALRHALHNDPDLNELAHRPLMLSIFTLAYQGAGPEGLPTSGTREAQQRQVFATYVERMLTRRGASKRVSQGQMRRWLTFLAARMQQHHQTVFYLERLQPNWLDAWQRRLLYRLSVGLFTGLVVGLVAGLVFGLPVGLVTLVALLVGMSVGLVVGLVVGLSQIQPKEMLTRSWRVTERSIVEGLVVGLVAGLVFGLPVGLSVTPEDARLVVGLVAGLVFGLVFGLTGMLASGFSANQLDDRTRLTPNQGIWRSVLNGLYVGLFTGLLGGLVFGLVVGLVVGLIGGELVLNQLSGLPAALVVGLLGGLVVGLLGGLVFGLGAFLQHFTLRFWLCRADSLPWNLVPFLDEAVERLLLRRAGGGYIFIHRLLLDYFADLEQKDH